MNQHFERTALGFLVGALVGNIIGLTCRALTRNWYIAIPMIFAIYQVYQISPGKERVDIIEKAERTMLGTPSEDAVAEAEEKGEEAKPEPKVVLTKVSPVEWDNTPGYDRGTRFDAVEVVVTNNGLVNVRDLGLSCTVKKVGDHPEDEPHRFKADAVQFVTLKAGDRVTLRYRLPGLHMTNVVGDSFQCTPFWEIDNHSALAVAGRKDLDLTLETEVTLNPGQRSVRLKGQTETIVTVAGEVSNKSTNRFVKGLRLLCESEIGDDIKEHRRDVVFVTLYVSPGETRRFEPKDVERYRTANGYFSVTSVCRVEATFEESADDREERLAEEVAEKDKLAKMTPAERKRYRESTKTPWGRVINFWR